MTASSSPTHKNDRVARTVFWIGLGVLVASLIFAGIVRLRQASPSQPQLVTAVDFSLPALDGGTISLADYKGRTIVLNFWASWCVPCTVEMPEVESFYKAHQGSGIVVLGINVGESADVARDFVQREGVTFPIALDEDSGVATSYGMRGLPMTIVIDKTGTIHWNRLGSLNQALLEQHLP